MAPVTASSAQKFQPLAWAPFVTAPAVADWTGELFLRMRSSGSARRFRVYKRVADAVVFHTGEWLGTTAGYPTLLKPPDRPLPWLPLQP